MAEFYRGHSLSITSDAMEVWWPRHERFSIEDLRDVYVFRDVASSVVVRGIGASAVMLVATAVSWQLLRSPTVALIGVLVVLAPAVIGGACMRTQRPPWELRAVYQGRDVHLFSSRDQITFSQVKRALVRAIEANERENYALR